MQHIIVPYRDASGGYRPVSYILERSVRADVKSHMSCNAVTCRFFEVYSVK